MAYRRLAAYMGGREVYQTDADPNGVISPIAVGSIAIRFDAGNVGLYQCTVLPSTWVDVGSGSGPGGVPLSNITASLADTAIDNTDFSEGMLWSTLTTKTALALAADAITSGNILRVSSTSATQSGRLATFETASTAPLATGAVRMQATAAHTGSLVHVDTATATGVGLNVVAPSLTTGKGLNVYSSSATATGNLAAFTSDSAGNLATGAVLVAATAAHTGSALAVESATVSGQVVSISSPAMTTGTQYLGVADGLTTGSLLDVSTASVPGVNSTLGLLRVANTGNSTLGITARIQSSSAAGSGLTVMGTGRVGIGTSSPSATLHNTGSTVFGALAVADTAAPGPVGGLTAALSVDIATSLTVNQTTAGALALTLASPTTATAGRVIIVCNIGTQAFSMYGVTITTGATPQTAAAQFFWDGGAWRGVQ